MASATHVGAVWSVCYKRMNLCHCGIPATSTQQAPWLVASIAVAWAVQEKSEHAGAKAALDCIEPAVVKSPATDDMVEESQQRSPMLASQGGT